ncbi:hypothetical protein FOA52_008347 [Chlamydomonas sp. UWO 241]|nr:hypothetical protein FOA52_008347 [Chlamydomonas sp. UWO 241]
MYQAALIEAEEASAHATAVSHAVLFSHDLWRDQLWQWLDCGSKRALRATSVEMHDQVDAAVTALASPEAGFTADELSRALVRWPGVRDLALLGVCDVVCMLPLSTTSLPRLTRLTIREPVASVSAWGLPEPSVSVAASIQVIDISCCYRLTSIAAVRNYGQLRCLRMPWVLGVSALSPLAACSQLEEVWMAGVVQLKSLSPLEACPRLRKLDLRDCGSLLQSQVGNLQLSCTELAHPSTVELEGLVDELLPYMTAVVQAGAARALAKRAGSDDQNQVAIAAAGAIPPLVQLLGQHSTADVQKAAAGALGQLAADYRENTAAIVAAGAIPALMQLRGQSPAPGMRRAAANLLLVLRGPDVQ